MCTREVCLEAPSPREAAHQLIAVISPHLAGHIITANTTDAKRIKGENRRNTKPWDVLVFLNFCKILVKARFCEVCAQ